MSRQIQIRRGSATDHANFTGAIGEITMDTTNKTLRVHDGTTAGGTILAKKSEIPTVPTFPDTMDYVVETQLPTADNNYTWYRKYKSGWVEQGGIIELIDTWGLETATLPVEMSDTNYSINVTDIRSTTSPFTDSSTNVVQRHLTRSSITNITTTSFQYQKHDTVSWVVYGVAASE